MEQDNRKKALLALAIVALLAGVGLLVMNRLMSQRALDDCVMSGRKNCVPVDEGNR